MKFSTSMGVAITEDMKEVMKSINMKKNSRIS